METQIITDRINRIKIRLPNNPLKTLNSYVVKGDSRNLLIDTGFHLDESFLDLREGLDSLSVDMARTDIFLTHCHADHTGNAGRIASDTSRVYSSAIDKKLVEFMVNRNDDLVKHFDSNMIRDGFPKEERNLSLKVNPAARNNERTQFSLTGVDDGHIFDLGGLRLRTIYTPGHTPGHMCLSIDEDGALFTGDHVLFDITPNITDWMGMDDALGSYIDSLRKIRKMDVQLALPGHRESGDIKRRIDELLRHHEVRLKEAFDIVASAGKQSPYETAAKMKWAITRNEWREFPPSQKFFAVGEARSHLDHLVKLGKLKMKNEGGVDYFLI